MCGFTITKEPVESKLQHRGIEEFEDNHSGWNVRFNSLPLSSYETGITQPFKIGTHMITFNGEIFNYNDLMRGCKSDIHYLYKLMEKCKNNIEAFYKESLKWDGFWAICVINSKGDVYSFTDPLGKKQLYYSPLGIASEIKAIAYDYKYKDYNENHFGTHNTNFYGIDRFMPGKLYKYEIGSNMPFQLMSLNYVYGTTDTNIIELINESVRTRLDNKYDGVSLLLSGGLDSNIILHHALKYTNDIDIVTIENGETENVRRICEMNGLNFRLIDDKFNMQDFERAVYHYEYSLDYGSLMPNYMLFKEAKNSLVLTGDGADELFSGYTRSMYSDTWQYDVFKELPFYHNIRLDRMSMAFTKEARSPLMSLPLLRFAKRQPRSLLLNKKILRDAYKDLLPDFIINGSKKPLRYKNDKKLNLENIKLKHEQIWNDQIRKFHR